MSAGTASTARVRGSIEVMASIERVCALLEEASEALADDAMALLSEALATDDEDDRTSLRSRERELAKARRAVEKALSMLAALD